MPYAHPEYLCDPEWLARHLDDPDLRLFDVTGKLTGKLHNRAREDCYEAGHIPGAAFLDVAAATGGLSAPDGAFPWSWPEPAHLGAVLGAQGVSDGSRVVVYAATPRPGIDNGTMWSTRAWWLLHHAGARVAVLDGGWEKWVAEGRPVSTTPHRHPPATFDARVPAARADKADVLAALAPGSGACVVNALPAASFAGADAVVYGPRKGHITGSVNVPMGDLLHPERGTFLPAEGLQARLAAAGALDAGRVITYCGGGIAATTVAFALALLGRDNVAVYDNSLLEWAADPALPMTDPAAEEA